MKNKRTKTWVKVVKRVVGFITLYLLLVLLVMWIQHCSSCVINPPPNWSYLTTLLKVSKVFGGFALGVLVVVLVVSFFMWCFEAD